MPFRTPDTTNTTATPIARARAISRLQNLQRANAADNAFGPWLGPVRFADASIDQVIATLREEPGAEAACALETALEIAQDTVGGGRYGVILERGHDSDQGFEASDDDLAFADTLPAIAETVADHLDEADPDAFVPDRRASEVLDLDTGRRHRWRARTTVTVDP